MQPNSILARIALITVAGTAAAQSPAKPLPTFDWVFSDEIRRVAALPTSLWLSDHTLLIYDSRAPMFQRRFEVIDPRTGNRREAFRMADAVRSLNALLPQSQALQSLGWPDAVDPAGKHALYIVAGDLFVLDAAA
jgi:hypothetical protein